ncbi:hypothetical protein L1987_18981 [Smallanthus sonchifolius]|uniref:Uncharacterized protein n=1 Tax=Smallanthus sonchifolius TaxID=185202 RepID=A0ACB9J291_9ASTR|nr:hypothetical protein L1987_18981 [Smallanthus sonchifolius]
MASSSSQAHKRARLVEDPHEGDAAIGEGQPDAPLQPPPPLHPHQLLSFAPGTPEHDRLTRMVSVALHASRTIDWSLMGQLGVREWMQQLLPPHWRQLLVLPREQYVELTLEFFSAFRIHRSDLPAATSVEFSLGGSCTTFLSASSPRGLVCTQKERCPSPFSPPASAPSTRGRLNSASLSSN